MEQQFEEDVVASISMEAVLQENAAYLASVLDLAGEAIIAMDEAHTVVLFNQAAETIFGYQAEEVVGRPVDILIPPRFVEAHRRGVERFAGEEIKAQYRAQRSRVHGLRKDGSEFPAEASISKVRQNGRTTFITVMRDISTRQRMEAELREREQQYRSIFESVSDALFINALPGGELVDFNPAAAHMHGYTVEEFRQLEPGEFVHPDSKHLFRQYLDTVAAGGLFRTRAMDVRKDGTAFHVEVLGTSFIYKGELHTLGVVRDVTEEVKAFQLLEERVEERTRGLQTLLEVSRNVSSILDVDKLLTQTVHLIQDTFGYYHVHIGLIEDDVVVLPAAAGVYEDEPDCSYCATLRLGLEQDTVCSQVAGTGKPRLVPDISQEPRYLHPIRATGSGVVVPLKVKEQVIGLLDVENRQTNAFDESDVAVLQLLANQVAVAIENARLYKQAQSLAALQERQKLARELHDSVSQALYGISLGTRTALAMLDGSSLDETQAAALRQPLEYTMSLAKAGQAEMRALIFELRPESLEVEGLIPALTRQTKALSARHEIKVQTTFGAEPDVSLAAKEVLYRVAQEALHNVVRHAGASRVEVSLLRHNDDIVLEIRDDGRGFDPQGHFPGHLGLQSMRERVEGSGGALVVTSAPGDGTCIQAKVKAFN